MKAASSFELQVIFTILIQYNTQKTTMDSYFICLQRMEHSLPPILPRLRMHGALSPWPYTTVKYFNFAAFLEDLLQFL
jgi:hypothetical protein